MEIRPADLGGSRAVNIVRQRASSYQASRARGRMGSAFRAMQRPQGKPKLNAIGRFITRGSGMDEATAAEAVAATNSMTRGMMAGIIASSAGFIAPVSVFLSQGNYVGASAIGAMWAGMATLFTGMPIALGRKWINTSLNEIEINQLASEATSPLEKSFAQLVKEISRQGNVSPEAEDGLREALHAIGDAMDRLPPVSAGANTDVATLQRNAYSVRARADAETDPITQASLSRQADALERSATAAERSAVLIRRTTALHEELAAQIEALRLGLAAFYVGDADTSGLASLSENVRAVAAEATSVASARAELDSVSRYQTSTPEPQILNVRAG